MRRTHAFILGAVLVTVLLAVPSLSRESRAQDATPVTVAPGVVSSEVLGHAIPAVVTDPELSLARVTIMPGASIPRHHHLGTQIGTIVQGELTYTVFSGDIALHRGNDASGEPYKIGLGETVTVYPGDTLVESPGGQHEAHNFGDDPIVIYLSTLIPNGAPRSVVDSSTPTP